MSCLRYRFKGHAVTAIVARKYHSANAQSLSNKNRYNPGPTRTGSVLSVSFLTRLKTKQKLVFKLLCQVDQLWNDLKALTTFVLYPLLLHQTG